MSAIELLFEAALKYERTHQLVLFTLFTKSDLLSRVVPHAPATLPEATIEFENGLFDLAIPDLRMYFEIKFHASLGRGQFERQHDFAAKTGGSAFYIMLGASRLELTGSRPTRAGRAAANVIDCPILIPALQALAKSSTADVGELAAAYGLALRCHWERFETAYRAPQHSRDFYYSLYNQLRNRSPDRRQLAIYSATNPAGPVFIMNHQRWARINIDGTELEVYAELVNAELCIKFTLPDESPADRRTLRRVLRERIHDAITPTLRVTPAGRLGRYMSLFKIDWDFKDASLLDDSARVFQDVAGLIANLA